MGTWAEAGGEGHRRVDLSPPRPACSPHATALSLCYLSVCILMLQPGLGGKLRQCAWEGGTGEDRYSRNMVGSSL